MYQIQQLRAPNLQNPYSGIFKLSQSLRNMSNDIENQEQVKRNNLFRDRQATQKQMNNNRDFNFNVQKHNDDLGYKNKVFNQNVANDQRDFSYQVGRDNARDNQWRDSFDFNKDKFLKDYQLSKQRLETPKPMTPYQEESIRLRQEAADAKRRADNQKALETLSLIDNWNDLNTKDQLRAVEYYNKTGLKPKIKSPWFGDTVLDIPISKEMQDKAKENYRNKYLQ